MNTMMKGVIVCCVCAFISACSDGTHIVWREVRWKQPFFTSELIIAVDNQTSYEVRVYEKTYEKTIGELDDGVIPPNAKGTITLYGDAGTMIGLVAEAFRHTDPGHPTFWNRRLVGWARWQTYMPFSSSEVKWVITQTSLLNEYDPLSRCFFEKC